MRTLALIALLSLGTAAQAADVSNGWNQGPGGFYNPADRSGPYAIDPTGTPRLIGGATVADPNNAAYSSAGTTFATGASVVAGRALYLNCSASGSVTLSMSGGGSLAYPVTAGANVLPFAVTSVSADTASCTHQTIN